MTSISQLPAEEIHRLMTTPGAMRLEDIPLVHLRAAELLKEAAEDKARLDYLGEKFAGASDSERYLPFRLYWGKGQNKTIRQVIDKAREFSAAMSVSESK